MLIIRVVCRLIFYIHFQIAIFRFIFWRLRCKVMNLNHRQFYFLIFEGISHLSTDKILYKNRISIVKNFQIQAWRLKREPQQIMSVKWWKRNTVHLTFEENPILSRDWLVFVLLYFSLQVHRSVSLRSVFCDRDCTCCKTKVMDTEYYRWSLVCCICMLCYNHPLL